ncbi:hypothetical protein [Bdellovibrio bacteriovorus]|uniref:hypothetical protein n=1 Tax=Bdellovibrio bacteriovorus TaxID=959 RepID=UPI0035A71A58
MKWFVIFFLLMTSMQALALGLAGAYPEGGAQVELQRQHEIEEVSQGALIGYGVSSWLNPSLNVTQIHAGSETRVRTGIGSISAWSSDFTHVAFSPGYFQESGDETIHLCGEASFDIHPRWTPYGRFSWESTEVQDAHSELIAGVRWSGAHLDVIAERYLQEDHAWKAGVNWRWDQNIELNVEAALPPAEHSWGVVVIIQPGGGR